MQQHDHLAGNTDQIMDLMAELDQLLWYEQSFGPRGEWVPSTERGKAVYAELTSGHNREALRSWYARFRGMELNPTADALKRALEREIGERLP